MTEGIEEIDAREETEIDAMTEETEETDAREEIERDSSGMEIDDHTIQTVEIDVETLIEEEEEEILIEEEIEELIEEPIEMDSEAKEVDHTINTIDEVTIHEIDPTTLEEVIDKIMDNKEGINNLKRRRRRLRTEVRTHSQH